MTTQIGRKIYYELSTGNVILDTGDRSGDVVATTETEDFTNYAALAKYQQSAVGVLQLTFGEDAQNFATYPCHVDITQTPPVIAWDTSNPIGATLADVQTSKIAQLRAMYQQTLNAGFKATLSNGTTYTFGWTTDDMATLDATQKAIDKAFLSFPITYGDVNGAPVPIASQTDLDTIEHEATNFFAAQHQQVLTFVGDVQSATTTTAVNAVQWTAATYA